MLGVRILASGSSGNATYVRSRACHLLVDAGISFKRLQKYLAEVGIGFERLDGILISHEHIDHVRGLPLIRKYFPAVPIFATAGTAIGWRQTYRWDIPFQPIRPFSDFCINDLTVSTCLLSHDAVEPIGFRFSSAGYSVALVTDLGTFTHEVVSCLTDCDLIVVEANHDEEMLWNGRYPLPLKRRISSETGHLSNRQAAALVQRVLCSRTAEIVLAHVSQENNDADLAKWSVLSTIGSSHKIRLTVASRFQPTRLIVVGGTLRSPMGGAELRLAQDEFSF